MELRDVLKKAKKALRGGVDEEEVRRKAEEFQGTVGLERPEEEGLEEGDLTDYSPRGLIGGGAKVMKAISRKGVPARNAEDIVKKVRSNPIPGKDLDYKTMNKPAQSLPSGMQGRKEYGKGLDIVVDDVDIKDAKLLESLATMRDKEAAGKYAPGTFKKYLERAKKRRPDMFSEEE